MMREIKFRVWDGIRISTSPIYFNNSKGCIETSNNAELMQYTGLKDKNGVEIYEGDIIYLAGLGDYEIEFPFIELYESCFERDIGSILGNIYENPELLERD